MEWFAWLTKPPILMTGLDILIMIGEVFVLIMACVIIAYFLDYKCKAKRKWNE